MATLSSRRLQDAAVVHVKRLIYGSSALGFLSLFGVAIVHGIWPMFDTQGRVVAFAVLVLTALLWFALPLAALDSLAIARRMRSAWWMMLVAASAHAAMNAYLEATLVQEKERFVEYCTTTEGRSRDFCELRISSIAIAAPIIDAFLPICAIFLLIALFRAFPSLPQDSRYDSLMDDDVPPGWHTPPAELAPDSSASDSEDELVSSPRPASAGWYEMGKKEARSKKSLVGGTKQMSWSAVRKARREKQVQKARGSS
ncbi:hypothetical protein JCM8097_007254 [Rhodosporidiobolus ruineniae]